MSERALPDKRDVSKFTSQQALVMNYNIIISPAYGYCLVLQTIMPFTSKSHWWYTTVALGKVASSGANQIFPGSVAVYTCSAQHQLNDSSTRVSQDNGTWSGNPPTCELNSKGYCMYSLMHDVITIFYYRNHLSRP